MVSLTTPAGPGHEAPREPLVAALDRAGVRVTEPRRAVAGLIDARSGHFTAADLLTDARTRRLGIGRATVFRALDLFAELGVLDRLDLPEGGHAYVACAPAHHHHAICSGCGRVTEVDDHALTDAVAEIERHTGWRIESHRLELYGRCPSCLAPRPA